MCWRKRERGGGYLNSVFLAVPYNVLEREREETLNSVLLAVPNENVRERERDETYLSSVLLVDPYDVLLRAI
jgi:hypothetical protein